MPLVGLLWLLVHHQINSVKNKMLMEVVKSAQSTSSCFCFDSYLGWPILVLLEKMFWDRLCLSKVKDVDHLSSP